MLADMIACCKHRRMTIQSEGGVARAAKLSSEERSRIAKLGALKRWGDKSPVVVEHEERAKEVNEVMGGKKQEVPPPAGFEHTATDALFDLRKPGYYIFEKEEIQKTCWYCGEGFRTRMKLNKFCSPDHKERWLIQSFRMGKE